MSGFVTGQCLVCGGEIAAQGVPSECLVDVCQGRSDRELLGEGGTIYLLREEPKDALFPVGTIRVTARAVEAIERARQQTWDFLARHVQGDWGEVGRPEGTVVTEDKVRQGAAVTDDAAKLNKIALHNRHGQLLSSYQTAAGDDLLVITELGDEPETTVLLPQEH